MIADRFQIRNQWQKLEKQNNTSGEEFDKLIKAKLNPSVLNAKQRAAKLPAPVFDDKLPVSAQRKEIADAISQNQVFIIAGETGSGKTTQLPKICLELKRGVYGQIAHTQPRRIAARSVAQRIAEELNTPLGNDVGYKVRFTDQVQSDSYIKLMTDGILLAETQNDRFLETYDTIIIDEAHERSLNIDFLLGYIQRLLPKRPELKFIITSATIEVERFSKHFDQAPVIEVSGRSFPVEVQYRPVNSEEHNDEDTESMPEAVLSAVEEAISHERNIGQNLPGDILVFCSSEREIRELADQLRKKGPKHTEIIPLYARLSSKEQHRIFESHRGRRIIIATNIAETSLTVPNIHYVIDTGTARISRYNYRSKVQCLPIEAISQASANQRKGRCGRVSAGICYRLYSEEDFISRPEFTTPEILRTNLSSVILQMENLKLGDIDQFPFIDKPEPALIKDGYRLLEELGALNKQGRINSLGRSLAKLPIDPKLGRMILAAKEYGCLYEILIIASALSIQDPRERPHEKQSIADQRHQQFQHKQSDFLSFVNLWTAYEEQRQTLSNNQLGKYSRENFLSYMRMREWRDIHHQLKVSCKKLGYRENSEPASYENIHKTLLSGLLSHIGHKALENRDSKYQYQGARNTRFYIFPGSALIKNPPQWLVAAELVETSKLYARLVATIEPEWIESVAKKQADHLIKYSYSDPAWQKKRGEVTAKVKATVYGLVLNNDKRNAYKNIDPKLCRELFINKGLVAETINTKGSFLKHNHDLISEVEEMESKIRRRDILVHEQVLCDFYNKKIPENICTSHEFEIWRQQAESKNKKLLYVDRETLLKRETNEITEAQFPDTLSWNGLSFPLKYHFEPGHKNDGVTLICPPGLINQIPVKRLEWLVPGMLRDKCISLLKALPKQYRRNLAPVPDFVDRCLSNMTVDNYSLSQQLTKNIKKLSGMDIPDDAWKLESLDPHYLFNIAVIDENYKTIIQSRDLNKIKENLDPQLFRSDAAKSSRHELEKEGLTEWNFPELPEFVSCEHAGISVRRYPALVDKGNCIDLKLVDSPLQAQQENRRGLRRLLILNLTKQISYLKKQFNQLNSAALNYRNLGNKNQFIEALILTSVDHCFELHKHEEQADIRNRNSFQALIKEKQSNLIETAEQVVSLVDEILDLYQLILKKLKGSQNLAVISSLNDINSQVNELIYPGFLYQTPMEWLRHFPRYLKAVLKRLEKLEERSNAKLQQDKLHCHELQELWKKYNDRLKKHQSDSIYDRELVLYRWLIEEYRVSLFAQELKTCTPISAKRLEKQWQLLKL